MNAGTLKAVLVVSLLVWVTACSLAPHTPRVDAASIGKNQTKLESNLAPTSSIGFIYGAGENVDVGLEVEQLFLATAWTRYSFINNPNGLSFAGNAAVFLSSGDYESNGWYAGLLLSNQFDPAVRWSAGFRYAVLDYEYGDFGRSSRLLSDIREFDNPDDASHNGQLELSMSWRVKPHVELALGASCQHLFKNTDPTEKSERCFPIIGFSFYRL